MKILALDPGPLTGFVLAWDTGQILYAGQIESTVTLTGLLASEVPHVIVCESFQNSGNPAADLTPVEVIGVVKYWAKLSSTSLIFQTRSQKEFWGNDKLKKLGLYTEKMPHKNDAVRHLLYYITFTLKDDKFIQRLK